MAITMFVPGFKTSRSDERHGDGLVIHSDTGHTLVIDGFDGGAPTTALVSISTRSWRWASAYTAAATTKTDNTRCRKH